jgi:hypothetical protein
MFDEYRERVRVYGGSKRRMSRAAAVRALLRFALLTKGCKGKPVREIGAEVPKKQLGLFGQAPPAEQAAAYASVVARCECTSAAMHAVLCQSEPRE